MTTPEYMRSERQARLTEIPDVQQQCGATSHHHGHPHQHVVHSTCDDNTPTTRDQATDRRWAVVRFDGVVVFAQLVGDRLYVHGREAMCRWCFGQLVVRDGKVFCGGQCGRFQGDIAMDLSTYLRWDGVRSFTLRREIARTDGLRPVDTGLQGPQCGSACTPAMSPGSGVQHEGPPVPAHAHSQCPDIRED